MSEGPSPLGPVYAGAAAVSFHHGQVWTGTPPEYFAYLDAEFDFRPDDVWLLSYPRSGTAWSHEVINAVLCAGDIAALERAQQEGRVPKFSPIEIGIGDAARLAPHLARWKALPSPRVIPTHVPPRLFPHAAAALACKRVYIVRDPRDVAVSRYHLHRSHRLLGLYRGSWDDFFEEFAHGRLTYGSWFDHTAAWGAEAQARPAQILVLTYERLQTDFAAAVRRLADHLGKPLSDAAVAAIAAHTSFTSMSANPFTNRAGNPVMDFSVAPFLRKGTVGGWREYFTPAQALRMQALWDATLRGTAIEGMMTLE